MLQVAISAYGANIRLTRTLEEGRDLARRMADAGEVSERGHG